MEKISQNNQDSKIVIDTLSAISQIAASAKDLPSLWEPLFEIVLKTLQVDAGTLMTLEGDYLVRRIAKGMAPEIMKEPPIHSLKGGISWRVVKSKKPAVITDLSKEKIASKALSLADLHSLVTVPMLARDQVIGVMSIFTRKERQFSEKDLHLFATIANQAAVAIISIRAIELLEENRQRLAEVEALNELSRSIATLFDFEETLYSIIGLITKILGGNKGIITLFNHQEKLLKATKPAFGLSEIQVRDFRTRPDEGASGQAFCKGVPILKNTLDLATSNTLRRAGIGDVKSLLAAPLKVKSQTLGVIHIFSTRENNFQPDDLRLLSILSAQAAVVVNSSYIYREIEEERKKDVALLTSIGEGVLAVDQFGQIILLNKAGEKITGFLHEELLEKDFRTIIGLFNKKGQALNQEESPINQVLKEGEPISINEIYLKKRDGSLFPAYLSVAATRDADDQIIGAIVVFRDISKELEVEQMKQELVSIATHELRTPITGIKGYLAMVLEGDAGKITSETKEILQEVVKINQRLADLVDDLLNVGRIEQGRIEIKSRPIDLTKLIEDVVEELMIQAKEKNLELKFERNNLPQVKADPERVRQVLTNLIGNAIKFTFEGKVEIILEKKEREIVTHVKDTGIGISREDQKRLFEKFYRIKTDKTRPIAGTGLGLWICKQLVEKMAGKIWFESEEGKGSTFSFSLPVA